VGEGKVRVVFKYGKDEASAHKRLIVSGLITIDFSQDGKSYSPMRFTPDHDVSPGIVTYCDLREAPWRVQNVASGPLFKRMGNGDARRAGKIQSAL
jgi:hypothetical protein